MSWHYFQSSGSDIITDNLLDLPLKENFVLNDLIRVQCVFTVPFQTGSIDVDLNAEKQIKVFAPNLKAKQSNKLYFLKTRAANGNPCFLDVREGGEERNGN